MTNKSNSFWLLPSLIFLCWSRSTSVSAQIVPDNTTNTLINGDCAVSCAIKGGIKAQQNLFHSFQEFNVNANSSVFFVDSGAANIFSRVTGSNPSQILGTLGVSGGSANLFLINPNGIIFGENARLDLKGSFVSSTANAVRFGDLGDFSSNPSSEENLALLTIDPSALLFQQQLNGNPSPIEVNRGAILKVQPQQNILLLGDTLKLQGGILTAPDGNISLDAISGQGTIAIDNLRNLAINEDIPKGDIVLDDSASVDVSGAGGGNIYLRGDRILFDRGSNAVADNFGDINGGVISIEATSLQIQEGSFVSAISFGEGNGGKISIDASDIITIIGQESIISIQQIIERGSNGQIPINTIFTGLLNTTAGGGNSGGIEIESKDLIVSSGAVIVTSTLGNANSGNVRIDASGLVEIKASGIITSSNLLTQGAAGNVDITAQNFSLRDGGVIFVSTFGDGDGGNLTIAATDTIELNRTPANSFYPNGLYSNSVFGNGKGGDIYLTANRLLIKNGSTIAAASGGLTRDSIIPFGGDGGDIFIQVGDAMEISGVSDNGVFPSRILLDTLGTGDGGNLTIETGSLQLLDGAYISSTSVNGGAGGDLTISARDFIRLRGFGFDFFQSFATQVLTGQPVDFNQARSVLFTGTGSEEDAGEMNIVTPYLLLENGFALATASFGAGDSGSLSIQADNIEVISSIINSGANVTGEGAGLTIDTKTLKIINSSSVGTTSTNAGNAGNVRIRATESIEIFDETGYNPQFKNVNFLPGIFTTSYGGANAGNLEIETGKLLLRNGGTIASQSLPNIFTLDPNVGSGGNLTIRARSIDIEGKSFDGFNNSGLFTSTLTNGAAGNIQVITDVLTLKDTGTISVNSNGAGAAGELTIDAGIVRLDNGEINAATISGVGGNINILTQNNFWLRNGSKIEANSLNIGSGGNISISSPTLLLLDDSEINASAIEGNGGKINIFTQGLFRSTDSMLEASSQLGIDGIVEIDTPEIDPDSGLLELPEQTIRSENTVVQTCSNSSDRVASSFSITGKGGLLEQPQQIRSSLPVLDDLGVTSDGEDLETLTIPSPNNLQKAFSPPTALIEARGMIVGDRGQIILTATEDAPDALNYTQDRSTACVRE